MVTSRVLAQWNLKCDLISSNGRKLEKLQKPPKIKFASKSPADINSLETTRDSSSQEKKSIPSKKPGSKACSAASSPETMRVYGTANATRYNKATHSNTCRTSDGMGISDLWPILSSLSNDRVSFPVFLSRFIAQHGRPPRLAIDAYMFMFWSQLPGSDVHDPNMERRIIRNFMAKLWYLVQCNVSFVVVFDGKFKPGKLRNGHIPDLPDACSYDDSMHYFRKLHHSYYSEGSRLIDSVAKLLSRNCMDWVQAPGEAEAECAWLQKLGIVDFVVSDDSDTLVFGASSVLRMFNRVKHYNEDNEPVLSSTDYYVTPIYMSNITERTSLTRDHLVLIAVLRGGDYSSGSDGIGITRAKEIALCGTTVLSHSPRKKVQDFGAFPDVTSRFVDVFIEKEKKNQLSPDPFYGLKSALDRDEGLRAFNQFLDDFLVKDGYKVFGRLTNFKSKVQVDEFYALLYYFPFVNRRLFKFMPCSITFGEPKSIDADLALLNASATVPRVNCILSPGIIGESVCSASSQTFVPNSASKLPAIAMPRERKSNLKPMALKFLRDSEYWETIRLHRVKEFEGVKMAVLRFNRLELNERVYTRTKGVFFEDESRENDNIEPSPQYDTEILEDAATKPEVNLEDGEVQIEANEDDKLISFHVPLECVRYVAENYLRRYQGSLSVKRSPQKKKVSPQKTTLDSIWPRLSPHKEAAQSQAHFSATLGPPPKLTFSKDKSPDVLSDQKIQNQDDAVVVVEIEEKSPSKKSPRKRRARRNEIEPGQSTLTSFFENKEKVHRFHQSLFVISDDEASEPDTLACPSTLRYKPRPRSPPSPDESSPTKQTRRSMSAKRVTE